MSVNSSSTSNSSLHLEAFNCKSNFGTLIITACYVTRAIVIVPPSIYILYLGLQQWRQQRSFKTISHCDIFTYHMAVLDLIWTLGLLLFYTSNGFLEMNRLGNCLCSISFYGTCYFHALTCVERYLAVVHPVTYLGLKNVRGVRIRNISIVCVWLLCITWGVLTVLLFSTSVIIPLFCNVIFSLVVVSFCSISVLCVLIRPGPGEGGRDKERVDQSKQRAFVTVTAIMGALGLWFVGVLVSYVLNISPQPNHDVGCVFYLSLMWFNLPASLVSPLLFLLRAGKPPCCRSNGG